MSSIVCLVPVFEEGPYTYQSLDIHRSKMNSRTHICDVIQNLYLSVQFTNL